MSASLNGVLTHDWAMQIYVTNENMPSGAELTGYFHGYSIEFKGSKDVYYLNLDNMRMFVYRHKTQKNLNVGLQGCGLVRNTDEYMKVYSLLKSLGIVLDDSKLPAYI